MSWQRSLAILGSIGGLVAGSTVVATATEGTGRAGTQVDSTQQGRSAQRGQAQQTGQAEQKGQIDPQAQAVLKRMCSYVGGLKSLRVDTTTIDEKVATNGEKVQEIKESQVSVQRPNKIAIDRTGPAGHVLFRYDGKQFAVYSVDHNVIASAPAPSSLDAAIDAARDQYGIDAPGGDLITTDSYQQLLDGVTEGRYIGLEPVDGVMTHHLAMRKGPVDYQIWIRDGAEPVPVRYVITSRDMPGQPQFTIELRHFQADAPLSESSFALIAPPDAQRMALRNVTRSRM